MITLSSLVTQPWYSMVPGVYGEFSQKTMLGCGCEYNIFFLPLNFIAKFFLKKITLHAQTYMSTLNILFLFNFEKSHYMCLLTLF